MCLDARVDDAVAFITLNHELPLRALERIKEALDNNFTGKLLKHLILYLLIKT
jgi:hypothetical protein